MMTTVWENTRRNLELKKFNEDASFIRLYANKKDKKIPSPSRTCRTQTAGEFFDLAKSEFVIFCTQSVFTLRCIRNFL